MITYLSFASSTFEGQGARSGGQEECSVRLFAIFVCMSKVSSCSLLLAPCSLTQLAKVELIINAKPFLKWAGGKGQVLSQFDKFLPNALEGKKFDILFVNC